MFDSEGGRAQFYRLYLHALKIQSIKSYKYVIIVQQIKIYKTLL